MWGYLLNCLNSIAENIDQFVSFAQINYIVPNDSQNRMKLTHFHIPEANVDYFWRRFVENYTV